MVDGSGSETALEDGAAGGDAGQFAFAGAGGFGVAAVEFLDVAGADLVGGFDGAIAEADGLGGELAELFSVAAGVGSDFLFRTIEGAEFGFDFFGHVHGDYD
jgi:hypothetical protein